ncbi:TetR/AcrR family transcriptional regulator [Streptomyces sp. NBC_01808]|uniref:TetR/AcrR family transcriptional regulator n=1 Tax=Streptomyces sp. NBC_01808 TaxID=2975947 RepID=UPI002DD8CE70|nr:helix-turn-helix domain-containing protein [Streptomyces sp. NBC_01808]WSA38892.1 TetR/AcrR family transcriptional regulator [Streptomyces sp. NBC_01808]
MTDDTRPKRADAQRNQARVLEAAEAVLARDGLSASMRTIAEQAGVGLGTIYRHFPTQAALYQAVIMDRVQRLVAEAGRLAAAAEPGPAFFAFFDGIVENATRKKVLADAVADAGLDPKAGTADVAADMRAAIAGLLARAQADGAVREDLQMAELLALLSATCLAAERNQWSRELRIRTLAVVFDGLRRTPHDNE